MPSRRHPSAPRVRRWLTCLFPALLSAACATPPAVTVRPEPAPANLLQRCDRGPQYPDADVPLGDLLETVRRREIAQGVCVDRLHRLQDWAGEVSR